MSGFSFSHEPIDPAAQAAGLADVAAGGFVSFEGWVRNENEGREVRRLDYEAFEELALKEGARIVGFCGVGRSRDDDATLIVGEVLTLYLLEWAAGRGIGRALFAEAIGRMRALGYERATLWVLRDSARARRFYEAAGWIVDGNASDHAFGDVTLPIVRYACDL